MNCQEFEGRVDTLARCALADARHVAEASEHEESCAACAALLADERALSTGLRALASGMKGAEAPARAESALLAAFRARAASEGAEDSGRAAVAPSNVLPLAARVPVRRWTWAKTAAVASLAAAASLALFVLVRPGADAGGRAMIEPPPGAIGGQKAKPEVAKIEQPTVEAKANPSPDEEDASPAPSELRDRPVRASAAPRPRAVNASYGGNSRAASAGAASDARPQEIATDFIPLGGYTQAEEGHLVRVELPRSALASFGLPVGAESAGGRVKADVLLGEDGTARAIRFIR